MRKYFLLLLVVYAIQLCACGNQSSNTMKGLSLSEYMEQRMEDVIQSLSKRNIVLTEKPETKSQAWRVYEAVEIIQGLEADVYCEFYDPGDGTLQLFRYTKRWTFAQEDLPKLTTFRDTLREECEQEYGEATERSAEYTVWSDIQYPLTMWYEYDEERQVYMLFYQQQCSI